MPNAIYVKHLSFKYKNNSFYSLSDISLIIKANKCTGIIGPNGAGKSTFISALCGLLPSFEGQVFYDENQIQSLIESVKEKVALVPQEYAFYPQLSVKQNLYYFLSLCVQSKKTKKNKHAFINEILEQCVLTHVSHIKVSKLSGGYKRRLNIAIALVKQPKVLFLDEPTVGIDPESRAIIIALLEQFKAEGKTLLFTSHMLDEVEKVCDDIIILKDGKASLIGQTQQKNLLLSVEFEHEPLSTKYLSSYQKISACKYQLLLTSPEEINSHLLQLSQLKASIKNIHYSANSVEHMYKQGTTGNKL